MTRAWRILVSNWPLAAAAVSAAMLAIAHAFETFGHLPPCELCLKQRTVYWVALPIGLVGFGAARALKRPVLITWTSWLLVLVFLYSAALASYHAGVEWHWWPGPKACTGSGQVNAKDLLALLNGARIRGPQCDVAAWRMLGLSMAGWNAVCSLVFATVSVIAAKAGMQQEARA